MFIFSGGSGIFFRMNTSKNKHTPLEINTPNVLFNKESNLLGLFQTIIKQWVHDTHMSHLGEAISPQAPRLELFLDEDLTLDAKLVGLFHRMT